MPGGPKKRYNAEQINNNKKSSVDILVCSGKIAATALLHPKDKEEKNPVIQIHGVYVVSFITFAEMQRKCTEVYLRAYASHQLVHPCYSVF